MKNKKIIAGVLAAVVLIAGVVIAVVNSDHEHSFGEWETRAPADCENAEVQVRMCECGEEETREGEPAAGHTVVSISAKCLLETPMASMVVTADDLSVTGVCECGAEVAITEGVQVEGAPLVLGENTVAVKYGELTTTLTIQAEKLNLTLDGVVSDDTYVSSGSKDSAQSDKKTLSTKSDMFRTYIRVNISDILGSAVFEANCDNAKVQLVLTVTGGTVTEDTAFTLKTYAPAAGVTDVDFSQLTWNSVDHKEGAEGAYSQLHWSNGKTLANSAAVEDGRVDLTLAYSQIADFVDENGNILFALGSNAEDLKVGSLENKEETRRPVFRVILNEEHFHVFDQEVTAQQYLYSSNCKEKVKYYYSCACGTAGTTTFEYGEVVDHTYSALVAKVERTCVTNGMRAHYRCTECGKYFVDEDGKKVATSAESLKIAAGHNCGKLIAQKDATCTTDGLKAHYQCVRCKKYFVEVSGKRVETTKAALKIPATGHTYSNLIPRQEAACTEQGTKAHYRCTVCQKYFVEKDGKKVAVSADSLKISASHDYKLIPAKAATCTTDGNHKYYKCAVCAKYFDADKKETTKEAQKIPAGHTFTDLIPEKEPTCTEDGMKAHYRCTVCDKYFVEKDGKKVAVSADSLKISADHDYKLIPAKAATCTQDGNYKYYKCNACGKYFDADKKETTKEAQNIPAGHTFSDLIPRKEATCTEDGMKAHYRCTVCDKYFVEKDGKKVAVNVESLKISASHDMVTKFDDTHHWTACTKCGEETAHEDHCGGTATETERAKCEVCGQPYGELVVADPTSRKRLCVR